MNNGVCKNSTICTLAVGEKYVQSALDLILSLGENDNNFLVVTDQPSSFPGNILTTEFIDDSTHICQQKRNAIKEGLKRFKTVFFLDADFIASHQGQYYRSVYGDLEQFPTIDPSLPPGFNTNWPKNKLDLILRSRPSLKPVFDGLCNRLNVDLNDVFQISPASFFFTVDSEKTYLQLFNIWDDIAFWLKDNQYVVPDNISMGFAAAKAKIPVFGSETAYPWELTRGVLAHKNIGDWHTNNFAGWT